MARPGTECRPGTKSRPGAERGLGAERAASAFASQSHDRLGWLRSSPAHREVQQLSEVAQPACEVGPETVTTPPPPAKGCGQVSEAGHLQAVVEGPCTAGLPSL